MSRRRALAMVAFASHHFAEDVSLGALARVVALSPFHAQRMFKRTMGETPKQYTLRVRLDRAAARLLASRASVTDVALACGFDSHDVFGRAFRRRFGLTPANYRARGVVAGSPNANIHHAAVVESASPCIGLFRSQEQEQKMSTFRYEIVQKTLPEQPVLFVRKRVQVTKVAACLGEVLPRVFAHCQRMGIALAGAPFSRYIEFGPGLVTIEAGMPIASNAGGMGDIEGGVLQGGPVAMAVHVGSYLRLSQAHAAVELWIDGRGLKTAGAPWESYVDDPADFPQENWKTEVNWPVGTS